MSDKLSFTIHELIAELDGAANAMLTDRYGITISQFEFIAVLVDNQPADITSLAHCLRVSKAAVSKRVPAMVKAGLITVHDDPDHGRRVLVEPTSRARELVETAGRDLDDQFLALLSHPNARGIDPVALNNQLTTLTELIKKNGPLV